MIRKFVVGNGRSERDIPVVGNLVVGRDPACDISEPDPLLSRRHAEILSGAHGVSVRDLDSRNGVLVNGEKTREQVLFAGDVVQMGHLLMRYVEEIPTEATKSTRRDRRKSGPQPAAFDRFKTEESKGPGRWTPEPTPLPGRRTTSTESSTPRVKSITPVPRGRAAYEEATGSARARESPDEADRQYQKVVEIPGQLGTVDPDVTLLAAPTGLEPAGVDIWPDSGVTDYSNAPGRSPTLTPGDATFAAALAHLSGMVHHVADPLQPGGGARLAADAELRIVEVTEACAAVLGAPSESLVGDSLADVFVRGVRRAYAEQGSTLSFDVTRSVGGSIVVTVALNKRDGTE
ncbi:MAG: FHA domain-containing protein [Vicinamibacterales bacterium]